MSRVVPFVLLGLTPALTLAQLSGTVEQRNFLNPVTQRSVPYNIYLPAGYAGSTQRYPVILHLHGLGGNQGSHNTVVSASFETALAQNLIGPVIVAFPNGYTDAWWADSIGGDKPAETDVLQLILHVDATFRTIGTRGARVVQGFSMGGFGATKFYSKFPGLFVACVEYDGAIVTWSVMQQFSPAQAAAIFGGSQAYFDQYSPWFWTVSNTAALRTGNPIRMVVGALLGGNRSFRDHLLGLSIPVDYVEAPCLHDLACLLNTQGLNSAAFIGARLDLSLPCYANCDGSTTIPVLTVGDFSCFLNRFAAADPSANCDGSTTPPILSVADFACFLNRFAAGCS